MIKHQNINLVLQWSIHHLKPTIAQTTKKKQQEYKELYKNKLYLNNLRKAILQVV